MLMMMMTMMALVGSATPYILPDTMPVAAVLSLHACTMYNS